MFGGTSRDSWVYRVSGGFSKPPSLANPKNFTNSPSSRPGTAGMTRPSSAATLAPLSSTLPARPGTAGMTRSSSAYGSFTTNQSRPGTGARPGSAMSSTADAAHPVPHFVKTEKMVLRFYAHFFERKRPETGIEFRRTNTTHEIARLLTVLIYLEDETVEIHEEKVINSGIAAGQFLGRGKITNADGQFYTPTDFEIGKTYDIVGQKITITDADKFTREFFKKNYDIHLTAALPRPSSVRADIGAQSATGLGGKILNKPNFTKNGVKSQDYAAKKEQTDKTHRFLNYDGKVLRFKCIEMNGDNMGMTGGSSYNGGNSLEFALHYYLSENSVEVRNMKSRKLCLDDVNVLLRKGKLPKNWRDVPRGATPEYYLPEDLMCGSTVDCYGRLLMLLDCDEPTRDAYRSMGIEQQPIDLLRPQEVQAAHRVPRLGDGFLTIGGEEATLTTVYGQPKTIKNWKKVYRNQSCLIRCRAFMVSDDKINTSRNFTITFYLEDDTLSVFEDVMRNSGMTGGSFLKRGRYINALPEDSDSPRPFAATDIYLGNVISVNGCDFTIKEMDEMSVDFCESFPEEFPLFDVHNVVGGLVYRVSSNKLDLRSMFTNADSKGLGYINDETFVRVLDDSGLAEHLNDQEMMTIMRSFRGEGPPDSRARKQYYYHELVDLFSHLHSKNLAGRRNRPTQDPFLASLRDRGVQWRRSLRLDPAVGIQYVGLDTLVATFTKLGHRLSSHNKEFIASHFAVHDSEELKVAMQEIQKYAHVNSNLRPVTPGNSLSIEERRKKLLQGRGANESTRPGHHSHAQSQINTVAIDYYALCHEIYPCDWVQ